MEIIASGIVKHFPTFDTARSIQGKAMNTSTESRATPYISKSTFLNGLQCSKLLWSIYNARHLFQKVDDAAQSVFDQANEVAAFAKRMFPTGIGIHITSAAIAPSHDVELHLRLLRGITMVWRPTSDRRGLGGAEFAGTICRKSR